MSDAQLAQLVQSPVANIGKCAAAIDLDSTIGAVSEIRVAKIPHDQLIDNGFHDITLALRDFSGRPESRYEKAGIRAASETIIYNRQLVAAQCSQNLRSV